MRAYATDSSAPKTTNTLLWVGAAVIAGGAGYYYASSGGNVPLVQKASGNVAFKGGDQGFIDLKLVNSEDLSPNTKKLRFALPNSDDVSGLKVACMLTRCLKVIMGEGESCADR